MSVLPIVSPAHNADGIPLMPVITALYPFSLDEGSINTANCFLVKKTTVLGVNKTIPIPVKVTKKNLELLSLNESNILDYGDDASAGVKYRTQIVITPSSQLDQHSEYAVILSKDLAQNSVFIPKPGVGNVGAKVPLAKGPYTGLIANTYRIQIIVGGNENTAGYKVTRLSDNFIFNSLTAKKRFIELEKGIFFKFETGTYVSGDIFDVHVIPVVKVNEIYSWDFLTGDSLYIQPSDENSSTIVNLPVEQNTDLVPPPVLDFRLISVTPTLNSVLNNPGNKGTATIQGIDINTKYRVDTFNNKRIKIIIDNLSPVGIENGASVDITAHTTTTKAEIVDLINATNYLKASTKVGAEIPNENLIGEFILNGKNGGQVVFTFSKNIKTTSFNMDKLKILAESTAANYYGSIDFDYTIQDNKLIINFL
jgi:hypothetical protein